MSEKSQTLSVNFGDFSIVLEGYEDPFSIMKQVAEYMENRLAQDPELKNKPLEKAETLSMDLAKTLDTAGTVTLDHDVVRLKAVGDVDLPIVSQPSTAEVDKISQDVARALDGLKAQSETTVDVTRDPPLSLQNLVTEEDIKDVEMTFSTDRKRRSATAPVDLDDHAENTRELPFVGKSVNKNSKPNPSKIKIIRGYEADMPQSLDDMPDAASEPLIDGADANLTSERPARTFRKLKATPVETVEDAIEPDAATQTPSAEDVQDEKPSRYRKLKA
ncbi:MAG: hypothetical protein AAF429_01580 [Pseudomonadota bacterium]